jgi:phage protein D/phage baseplate assembly protein gpV
MNSINGLTRVRIEINDIPLTNGQTLHDVFIRQRIYLPALCELSFVENARDELNNLQIQIGASIKVSIKDNENPLFVGIVTALEYGFGPTRENVVRVRAYDKLYLLRKQQHIRSYTEVTLKDLFEQFGSQAGLALNCKTNGPLWHWLIQDSKSDLEFITNLAYSSGVYFTVVNDLLHLFTSEGIGEVENVELGKSLFEAKTEINEDPVCKNVIIHGWSSANGEKHSAKADTPVSGRTVPIESSLSFNNSNDRILSGKSLSDDNEGLKIAQAVLDRSYNSGIIFSGVAEGNSKFHPGISLQVNGLPYVLCGKYVVTQVNHIIDQERGYLSEISSIPPKIQPHYKTLSPFIAIVKDVDDPDKLGRVKATIPGLDNVETDWMQVVFPGAGNNKGMVLIPDVGDTVFVLPINNDYARSFVIGGVFGAANPFNDWGVEGNSVKRFTFLTPAGNKIVLDDNKKTLKLENSTGNFIELNPNHMVLHGETDVTLEAPGRAIVINGKSIDFKQS